MGTDINVYAEKLIDGKWQPIPEPRVTNWSKGKKVPVDFFEEYRLGCRPYDVYPFFGVIRYGKSNGRPWEEFIKPITQKKGLPIDLSVIFKEILASDCFYFQLGSNFGHSWLTLQEILDYDLNNQFVELSTYVRDNHVYLFESKKPHPRKFFTNGQYCFPCPDTKTIKEKNLKKVFWSESYQRYSEGFFDNLIKALSQFGSPENVRIIYWFD